MDSDWVFPVKTQLISLIENVSYAVDNQRQIDLILLEAFDTVPHRHLLAKQHRCYTTVSTCICGANKYTWYIAYHFIEHSVMCFYRSIQ